MSVALTVKVNSPFVGDETEILPFSVVNTNMVVEAVFELLTCILAVYPVTLIGVRLESFQVTVYEKVAPWSAIILCSPEGE